MKRPIYVVLGLPRSGTSLMMQMLLAGGIPLHADDFLSGESEDVLRLPKDSKWLKKCHGEAVKVLEPLTFILPREHEYKFILMRRNHAEQAKSFKKLMDFVGIETSHPHYLETLERSFERDIVAIKNKYSMYQGRLKTVDFEQLIEQPKTVAEDLQEFLRSPLNIEMMASTVRHRETGCLEHMLEMDLIKAERTKEFVAMGGGVG